MGSELRVADVMTKDVITVSFGKSILDVCKLMKRHSIGSIVVVEDKSEHIPKGIITDRNIIYDVLAAGKDIKKIKVENAMSVPIKVIQPTTLIEDAVKLMKDNDLKRLPVVDESGHLVGIVSEGDVLKIFPLMCDLLVEKAL